MTTDLDNDLHRRWTVAELASELQKDTRASDAQVLRVLAARIAAGSAEADTVLEWIPETQTWRGKVVDPGTFRGYEPGGVTYFGVHRYLTVIDSEPDTQDLECE